MNQQNNSFNFEELRVWQNSLELAKMTYELIKSFPKQEQYGLADQLRRAVVSIALNIAEGRGRLHTAEFIQFLSQARGSLYETVTCLKLAIKLGYLTGVQAKQTMGYSHEIHHQINALIKSLKERKHLG